MSKSFATAFRTACRSLVPQRITAGYATIAADQVFYGQPLHRTHPHLIKQDELTRGISHAEYAARRTALSRRLPHNSIVLVPGSSTKYMRGVAFYGFRQNANMFYLTGLDEPDTAMILRTDNSKKGYSMYLYLRPKDAEEELWTGFRNGIRAGEEIFAADQSLDISELERSLKTFVESSNHIYLDTPRPADLLDSCYGILQKACGDRKCHSLSPHVHRLRIRKSAAEIDLMRRAGQISGRALTNAMKTQWNTEAELQGHIRHEYIKSGAEREGYVPVIAAGERSSCIHYTSNDRSIKPDDMIFVDAGAEVGGYLADVSRAWPQDGKFTEAQRDLYQALLYVEKECIKMCTAQSRNSIQTIHLKSVDLLQGELRQLGFSLSDGDIERYLYPHRIGHHIGLEIHDCSTLGGYESLAADQTVTIEPGCYVPNDSRWPKHFRGLGFRIEDSVLVGEEVPTILSVEAVKEIADIEALR